MLIPLVAAALFAPSLSNEFTGWDDYAYIIGNPHMTASDGLARIWTTRESEQYYPLTFTSFWIEYRLWQERPLGYHATNVVLHALNTLLALLFLRALGLSRWAACVAGLLFAVHPVQVMSVAWIAQRKNLLSTLLCLLAMLSWVKYARCRRPRYYVFVLLAFAGALLSKTAVLTLPVALFALDVLVLRQRWRGSLVRIIPMLALSAGASAVTMLFEEKFVTHMPAPPDRPLIAAAALFYYVYLVLAPLRLLPFYARWEVSTGSLMWWLPLVGLLTMVAVLFAARRRINRTVMFGIIHFAVFLFPVLGLLAYGNLAITFVSDHYLYLPCIGGFLAIAVLVDRIRTRRPGAVRPINGVAAVVLCLLAARTLFYIPVFKDAESMGAYTLRGNPDCYAAHAGLGRVDEMRRAWPEAVEHYRRAYEAMPDLPDARFDLGRSLYEVAEYDEAEALLGGLHHEHPRFAPALFKLAQIASWTHRPVLAIERFEECLALGFDNAQLHYELAETYRHMHRPDMAAKHARLAIDRNPNHAWAFWTLAVCQSQVGQLQAAVATFEKGLAVSPQDVYLLGSFARLLATCPDDAIRDGRRAVELAEEASAIGPSPSIALLDTLAAAHAEVGQFENAVRFAQQAVDVARALGDVQAAEAIGRHVTLYKRRAPLRESHRPVYLP